MKLIAVLVAVCLCLIASARAELVAQSYTEKVISWTTQLDEVAEAHDLSIESMSARLVAAKWFFLGPCRGSSNDIRYGEDAIQAVSVASPKSPYFAAILEMIGILHRIDFGREPSADVCRFVGDLAKAQ